MDLIKLDNPIPIKAIPKETLNNIILNDFTVWLSDLLGLTDEVSAKRLYLSLDAIKDACWSMGFPEIKKMFTMYADSKLSVKPISNFLDRILVGKIIEAYKEQKPPKKIVVKNEISEDEKRSLINSGVTKCLNHYEETQQILEGYILFLYDEFYDSGYLPKDKNSKNKALSDAKEVIEFELINKKPIKQDEYNQIKESLKDIEKKKSPTLIIKAKEIMLLKYLRGVFKDESLLNKLKTKYLNA